jgi:hypothetical protein
MGRGRLEGVKDSRPRTVDTTQNSKHNKGGNVGKAKKNFFFALCLCAQICFVLKTKHICAHKQSS